MIDAFDKAEASARYLAETFGARGGAPDVAVVLGSGLSDAIPNLGALEGCSFTEIPGCKSTSVVGHAGELRIGEISGNGNTPRRVVYLRGRNHAYEGNSVAEVVHNVRMLGLWGVKGILLTNAAGCLHVDWPLGSLMLITDQINQSGLNPLASPGAHRFGKTFVDMTTCYDPAWQETLRAQGRAQGNPLFEGVYFGVLGPSYETPAEIRMMAQLGASAVGMSTVLEAIAARQLGMRVGGLSCLTNYGAGLRPGEALDHSHVVDVGRRVSQSMAKLVLESLATLPV